MREPEMIAAIRAADYGSARARTVDFWRELLGKSDISIPETRVDDSWRAGLVHLLLATRTRGGGKMQGSGLPYDALFLNDYMDMMMAHERSGIGEFADPNVDWLLDKQHASGMFIDVHNRGNDDIVTSHGQGLFALVYPYIMRRDPAYAAKVYPAVRRGVGFIVRDHRTHNEHGLLRPSIPYDAPMLTGYHTCHNLFALAAMRIAIRMARMMGEDADAASWTAAHDSYVRSIMKAIESMYRKEGYITSGLYDWTPGWVQGKKGWKNDFPNQDWENNLLAWPTELLDIDDPMLATTLATIRARKYREGCMSYRNGMHVHQYVTVNQAHQYLTMGDRKHALLDLYHVLLHNGSTHEGFENLVEPWTNRTPRAGCPPPHAWAAAKTALFIRNMMVLEYGGDLGLRPGERDLHLYSLVSPSWIEPGKKIVIRNVPTEMGPISSTLTFVEGGAEITFRAEFHTPPRHIAVRIPYGVRLTSHDSDGVKAFEKNGSLHFSPDVTRASLRWEPVPGAHVDTYQDILRSYRSEFGFIVKDGNYDPARAGKPFLSKHEEAHPPAPLSFELVRKAFVAEYQRRYEEHIREGGAPYPVEPPPLLEAEERRATHEKAARARKERSSKAAAARREVEHLGVGKPVRCSHALPGHPPELAADGQVSDTHRYWATDVGTHPGPAWWQVDLEEPQTVGRVVVVAYYNDRRHYGFTVETSLDGRKWGIAADRRDNKEPSTSKGYACRFTPSEARYVRVTQTHCSMNKGRHLVEVMVLGE
ncbi:MAG: discoidin domain-containing protein [Planctomycetota bacterium]